MRPELEFPCIYSGRRATVASNRRDGEYNLVTHEMPYCAKFGELDALAFIRATNLELARRRGVGLG